MSMNHLEKNATETRKVDKVTDGFLDAFAHVIHFFCDTLNMLCYFAD